MKKQTPRVQIRIAIITWNLMGGMPQQQQVLKIFDSNSFFESTDVICFCTQQCQRPLCMSFFCEDKSQWENDIIQLLKDQYRFQCSTALQGLHMAIFIKRSIVQFVQEIQKTSFRTLSLTSQGKGAICITLILQGQKLQFINCHLPAHQGQSQARNQAIFRIIDELVDKDLRTQVFFSGDFNYRIEMQKDQYKHLIKAKKNTNSEIEYTRFINRDQMKNQQSLRKSDFNQFQQRQIKFPPTYKLDPFGDEYSSQRIPGWTDRIFHRLGRSQQLYYTCQYDIKGSDHRPVIAAYDLNIQQTLSATKKWKLLNLQNNCQLI